MLDNDPFAFFGLVGTDMGRISSLSIVRYDKVCFDTAKQELDDNMAQNSD